MKHQREDLQPADLPPAPALRLGYVGVEAREVQAWEFWARDGIGFHTERDDGAVVLRMDDHARRFIISEGARDDVAWLGWEADDAEFEAARVRLLALGVECRDLDAAATKLRGVSRAFSFEGPRGLQCEITCDPVLATSPLRLHGLSGFIAGKTGIGHIAMLTKDLSGTRRAFEQMLGARHTDDIVGTLFGLEAEVNFFHMNERHHSLAVGQVKADVPLPPKLLNHIMIEVKTLEDVGAALVRCKTRHFPFGMDLGQHPNDKATSFYVTTPSGFDIEVAFGSVLITDQASWKPQLYDQFSSWGHTASL